MILVKGTRYVMGNPDRTAPANERPPRAVSVQSFWIDKTEVSVGDYRACVDAQSCVRPQTGSPACTFDQGDPLLPVNCVRWVDATQYCRHMQKRLPKEVEWELAAKGPQGARYAGGGGCMGAVTLLSDTTHRSCSGNRPGRVGARPGSASYYGVQDLSGNLEEWVQDFYTDTLTDAALPRTGAAHVLRGGGWLQGPSAARTTARNWGSAIEAGANVGFRCARDDSPK